ncbi:MAG: RecQ family ATP-dependent DNA helicase [Balneolaceae bacterium]|nr:RecQ family ATP-dependent DNA helicase [Balneolaceae bacterium]
MTNPKQVLNEVFGYETFRPLQEEIIEQVLDRRDTLVIMPTGGGKSICYQIPALIFDGLTLVVSPLISLMKDQVEQLSELGIPAVCLNSSLSEEKYRANLQALRSGEAKMLYLAPETLLMKRTRKLLADLQVDLFTIDEAHCISEWGHDFRPEYRKLAKVKKDFPDAPCLALTATATPRVREDIRQILQVEDSETFLASFDRKNLMLRVTDKENPTEQVLDFLYTREHQSGIIYCFSRRLVNELYVNLKKEGHSVKPYHAGLSEKVRNRNQDAFIRDDVNIIVATIAFGMGINKPDVRFVVHHDMPQNIESYYQQIGRAGRDGLRADCLLLYSHNDTQKIRYFINQKEGEEKKVAEQHLNDLVDFLETDVCRRIPLMNYFGEEYGKENCGMCDNCVEPEEAETFEDEENASRISAEIREGYEKELFDRLRSHRKTLADERDVTPYAIFPDATLMEMAWYYPRDEEQMLHLYGVGSLKMKRYGRDFLRIIREYCEERGVNGRAERLKERIEELSGVEQHVLIGEAFNAGQSIPHLAEEYGVRPVTIVKHLKEYFEEGNELRADAILEASSLSHRNRDKVLQTMEEKNARVLRPVYDALDKSVGYDELRVLQLYHMARD